MRNSCKSAMKHTKDPFEAAYKEQEESPPDSPIGPDDLDSPTHIASQDVSVLPEEDDLVNTSITPSASTPALASSRNKSKNKEDDDEEDDENMDVELAKFPLSSDPGKSAKMKAIMSQFTDDQMSRYESFRRSALQKANMKRLLVSITGTQKISLPMTIVCCGIAKMFVGELVETARIVMTERQESGPIRPCHIREAYRRLKLEGKVLKRSVPRLFR